ncbi:MAG: DNA methyltransferase [Deltaproteobacteria bacterium RIFOXYA2_FULL_42_10]|nr:MAG: DNA methyltransferase [Deltaproteobacteria bacterium RIFOXYA2_FULL_42_10]
MNLTEILDESLARAITVIQSKKEIDFPDSIRSDVDTLINKIDKNKSLVSALVTSLVKKITDPKQDIRLHRTDFRGGYSARSLDTSVTAPFFKKYFPKYANKESAFLTLATREKIKWTKRDGQNLKIRDAQVKKSFLALFDALENRQIKPKECLIYIFIKLHLLSQQHQMVFDETIESADFSEILNINMVLKMLERHFGSKLSSRLPVIAIYSVYQQLFKVVKRYEGKKLGQLNVHTSSDKHGFGDIEVWNADGTPFEMVEIKHNIPIDRNLIFDLVKKSQNTTIQRYYILTTYKENFPSKDEEEYISKFILKIKKDSGLAIIANGISPSLKYYLRFIDNYKNFVKAYTNNLIEDAKNSTEVKEFHITEWQEILKKHHLE